MTDVPLNEPSSMTQVSVIIPMYRDADRAIQLVRCLWEQQLPVGTTLEVIIVDDGSADDSCTRIQQALGHLVKLKTLSANAGRAVARNNGAALALGQLLLFLDCDCLPDGHDFIASHLSSLNSDVVSTTGSVTGRGDGFWHRYQTDASDRRRRQFMKGISFSGSSQNLMVTRAAFEGCGGFDPSYTSYGFEDRDLLIRIGNFGRVAWANASVKHMDHLTVSSVCRKMKEAGGTSSVYFSRSHPNAYRALGFARLDARQHFYWWLAARSAGWLIQPIARWVDAVLETTYLPYAIKKIVVKALTAFSYMHGTARQRVSARRSD